MITKPQAILRYSKSYIGDGMKYFLDAVNNVFGFITPISDWLWAFPTNYEFWSDIPVLGNFSLAVILLVGTGIFLTIKTRFIQVSGFSEGIRQIIKKRCVTSGISPAASFFLSTAMRVGPGNIIGVTGAITTGGPGALFWMWISAFFGMATAYAESVLAQIFKRKDGSTFVGGLPFYGRRLLKNSASAGIILTLLYMLYALFCFPAQGFNTVSSVGQAAGIITGKVYASNSALYWIAAVIIIAFTSYITFGGIKKVTRLTDKMVPVMAILYCLTAAVLIVFSFDRIPYFFSSVFRGAFEPDAIFGGAFGIALGQGIKRGLMSNEAGQGTVTMAAAAADSDHPCSQGLVQAVGVFLDTIVICTMTGFIIILGHLWTSPDSGSLLALDKLPYFLASVGELAPSPAVKTIVTLLVTLCFGMFSYTTLIGFISFSEISCARISPKKSLAVFVRVVCLAVIAFGMTCIMAGYRLDNLWAFSDLGNIVIVYVNLPLVFLGLKYVMRATRHYRLKDGSPFTSGIAGAELDHWNEHSGI